MRRAGVVLIAMSLSGLVGCGASAESVVERLGAAPLPAGASEISRESRDGDFERGPEASAEYSWPTPFDQACPELLGGYVDADYEITKYVGSPEVITDPGRWCADQLETEGKQAIPAIIVIVYPPGENSRYPSDGVYATLTPGRPADPYPDGTHLRLSAG